MGSPRELQWKAPRKEQQKVLEWASERKEETWELTKAQLTDSMKAGKWAELKDKLKESTWVTRKEMKKEQK